MKRLIVCCDGTWQKLESGYPTNVVKIAQAIKTVDDQGIHQLVFYDEGIGTESKFYKLFGGAFGWGIDRNIRDGYQFLSLNYEPGDEIYLFGFSRGAYTVRSLAGFIYISGLVSRHDIRQVPTAYELYRTLGRNPDAPKLVKFREEHSTRPEITLLGCWDTVGALGVPNLIPVLPLDQGINEKYRFHNTTLCANILNAAHAVAIDEKRKSFEATLMQPCTTCPHEQMLHQTWFPGGHGSVGGGTEETSGLSDAALRWMINHAQNLGLAMDVNAIPTGINCDPTTPFGDGRNGIFKYGQPLIRNISTPADFDTSVKLRWQQLPKYRPENLVPFRDVFEGTEDRASYHSS